MFEKSENKRNKRSGLAHFLKNNEKLIEKTDNFVKVTTGDTFFAAPTQCDQIRRLGDKKSQK